jgi:hypothetical protein
LTYFSSQGLEEKTNESDPNRVWTTRIWAYPHIAEQEIGIDWRGSSTRDGSARFRRACRFNLQYLRRLLERREPGDTDAGGAIQRVPGCWRRHQLPISDHSERQWHHDDPAGQDAGAVRRRGRHARWGAQSHQRRCDVDQSQFQHRHLPLRRRRYLWHG